MERMQKTGRLPKYLTVEEHTELASKLHTIKKLLSEVLIVVSHTYGVSADAAKRLEKLVYCVSPIDRIICELDDCFYLEHRELQYKTPYYSKEATQTPTAPEQRQEA